MDFSESESLSFQEEAVLERPIACNKATEKPDASSKSDHPGNPTAKRKEWSHTVYTCLQPQLTVRKQSFSIVGEIYGRVHDDPMDDLDVDMAIWVTTLHAAVHLGQDYDENLRYVMDHFWNSVGPLFNDSGKLISESKDITGVNNIKFQDSSWM